MGWKVGHSGYLDRGILSPYGVAMRALVLVLLVACGGDDDDDDDAVGVDAGLDAAVDVDSGPASCDLVTGIEVIGAAVPGQVVTLVATAGADAPSFTPTWSVPSGSLSSETGGEVDWTLAADAALHTPVPLEVSVTATADGCDADTATATVVADWPDGLRTIVLYNPSAPRSDEVARRYAALRAVPEAHLCGVDAADLVTLPGDDYPAFLDAVMACIDAAGPQVHAIVPVWGVPYKVSGRIRDIGNGSIVTTSLDAVLFFGRTSDGLEGPGITNPAYMDGSSIDGVYDDWRPWGELRERIDWEYFLVTRIDGADADAALSLVDRAEDAAARADAGTLGGTVYVDGNRGLPHPADEAGFGSYEWGEWNIIGVENVFAALGWYDVVADYDNAEFGTAPAPLTCPDALYYAGWYSFGHYNDAFTWAPGAVGGHLDSCSACDIRGETDWSAMALRRGITATFGAVNEPYVAGMPEYDQFFKYLTEGASYAEAAYESTVLGAWMMVWIGDPWYRPYPAPPAEAGL